MHKSTHGYAPKAGFFSQALAKMSEFQHPDMPLYTLHEYPLLLDSADMTPNEWNMIAQDIQANYANYDGFVVLHGTDTMAYTAAALSFMLENLGKPVILTGSQAPLIEAHTDARENLLGALLIAAESNIPEVCVYFNHKLFRGNRVRKVHPNKVDAFASPNYPLLGEVEARIHIHQQRLLTVSSEAVRVQMIKPLLVYHLTIFPGIAFELLEYWIAKPIQALILQSYGTGNVPIHHPTLIPLLTKATQAGIIIVNASQCFAGQIDMPHYASGQALINAGIISGSDMTPETILCKLHYLFSKYANIEEIKKYLTDNLRGELTPSPVNDL